MKFSHEMLSEYVKTPLSPEQVGELLTMAGFELEELVYEANDAVYDIKVCSNRGDGLSVFGLAREILAKDASSVPTAVYERALGKFSDSESTPTAGEIPVTIETANCDRFGYRRFSRVRNVSTPDWMVRRLELAGMRSIGLFVDLTNYVMLEVGQPLHAYDLERLGGPRIIVRDAQAGERITTLDEVDRELTPGQMMICDAHGPVGVAGVMGGSTSEVSEATTEVLLEAAHFNAQSVRKTRRQLGLNTEASYRFERSVDPENVERGLNRVANLLTEMGYGEWVQPGITLVGPGLPAKPTIKLNLGRARTLLGMDVPTQAAKGYLTKLGFAVTATEEPNTMEVTPPTWRFDIVREEDLVEELGRVHGYELIPEALPFGHAQKGGLQADARVRKNLMEFCLRSGFDQAMTHSLVGDHPLDNPVGPKIPLRTPGGPETSALASSLLPGLAATLKRNGGKGAWFELGKVFLNSPAPLSTHRAFAAVASGPILPQNRKTDLVPSHDFYSLKALMTGWAKVAGVQLDFVAHDQDPRFHPGRCARVTGGGCSGIIGQIHPLVAKACDLSVDTFMVDLTIPESLPGPQIDYQWVSRNPSIRRDIAVQVKKSVSYDSIAKVVQEAAHPYLEDLWLFDEFEGGNIPEGSVSLGLGLTLRKPGENFTDEEANELRERIVNELAKLGASQR